MRGKGDGREVEDACRRKDEEVRSKVVGGRSKRLFLIEVCTFVV